MHPTVRRTPFFPSNTTLQMWRKTPLVCMLCICVSACICVCSVNIYNGAVSVSVMKDPEPIPSCCRFTHTRVWGCANLKHTLPCVYLVKLGKLMTPPTPHIQTDNVFFTWQLFRTHTITHRQTHTSTHYILSTQKWTTTHQDGDSVCYLIPPSLPTYTQTVKQGLDDTWCCSCCLPLIPACISPAVWRQSDAQPQVLWSGVQTEAPVEIEKDKVFVTETELGFC